MHAESSPATALASIAATADVSAVAATRPRRSTLTTTDFLLNIIPDTVVGAFARGDMLQVLLFSVLFGLALLTLGPTVAAARRSHRARCRTRSSQWSD